MSLGVPKNHQLVLEFTDYGIIKNGILELPTLWSLDKNGNYRYWNLNIGIENESNNKIINVTPEYIERKSLPKGYSGVYWTESGVENTEKPIISNKTYVNTGKNIKNKNYTTPFTQAILDARSDFNYKIHKGSVMDKNLLNPLNTKISIEELILQSHRGTAPWRVFAMAIHDVNKNKNWRHVKFPCKLQPKLDGSMFIVVYHPKLPVRNISTTDFNGVEVQLKANIDSYTRGRESYDGQEHILWELYPVLKKYPGLHLVGELWKEGYGLQDISGFSRRQVDSKIKANAIKLDFNIFDCFYIDQPGQPFEDREATIDDIIIDLDNLYESKNRFVKQVPSYEMKTKEQLLTKYQMFLEQKMEGGVIRNIDSPYEVGIDKEIRSYQTLKIKPRPDGEWPVIGFKEGKGKESGAIIWICAENDEGVRQRLNISAKENLPELEDRKSFSVTPNIDYEKRYKIYSTLSSGNMFIEKIKGQLLTVSYSILSKDFLPQQPKVLRFRDMRINELLDC